MSDRHHRRQAERIAQRQQQIERHIAAEVARGRELEAERRAEPDGRQLEFDSLSGVKSAKEKDDPEPQRGRSRSP
jgi:hypothetical protein